MGYRAESDTAKVSAMSEHAITLEVLPAGYGNCLLVRCPVGKRTWRMLVHTGLDETVPCAQGSTCRAAGGWAGVTLVCQSSQHNPTCQKLFA
jgi:hypothetical protein